MNVRPPNPNAVRGDSRIARACVVALLVLGAARVSALQPDRAISQYAHSTWGIEQGLPHSVVRGIVQTADGYLWVATYQGLARFNGEAFTHFNKSNLAGLRRDTVLAFMHARDGALWIGTNGGGAGRLFEGRFELFLPKDGLPTDIVAAFAEAPDGSVWIGTSGGLCTWKDGRVTTAVAANATLGGTSVLALSVGADRTLWVGTRNGGLYSMREGGRLLFRGLGDQSVLSLFSEADGATWIGAGDGMHQHREGEFTRVDTIPRDQVTALLRDSDRTLWVGTYSYGLFRVAPDGSTANFTSAEGLQNNSVRTLFEDEERTLWVGTNSGLESFVDGKFITFGKDEKLSNSYVRTVFQDSSGSMWIGTAMGLNRVRDGETTVFTSKDGLSNDYVFSVAETNDGAIWVGTPNGLNRYVGGRFTQYHEKDGLPSGTIRALHCDRAGTLWIGTDGGAVRYTGGRFERAVPAPGWERTIVQTMAEGADGSVWIGSDGRGVARYAGGTFTAWNEKQGLPDSHILALHVDRRGTVWMGTDSAGLIRFSDGRFTQFTTASGLPSDKVLQLLEDQFGRLWFGGGRGIWYASLDELDAYAAGRLGRVNIAAFGSGDGIRSVQCNGSVSPSAARTADGRLWFPTIDGVATLVPKASFAANSRRPPVKIESIVVDGKASIPGAEVVVPPDTRQVEIHYSALTYISPHAARFRYRLEGYEDAWVEAEGRRVAYYTGVPPGRYTFRVIASNADGVWNNDGASFNLRLKPLFTQTKWFVLLLLASAAAVVALLYLRRVRSMKRREVELMHLVEQRTSDIQQALHQAEEAREISERQERLLGRALVEAEAANRAKSTFLANVSHELRTPLNAIIGFAHILEMHATSKLEEKHQKFVNNIAVSGEHLLRLINEILDLAKVEAGRFTLEPEVVEVKPLLDAVAQTAKGLMVGRGIDVEVSVAEDVETVVADATKLKQIVYNLVSNAVKFSPNGTHVRIEAWRVEADQPPLFRDALAIAVIDHGIGISPWDYEVIFEEFKQIPSANRKPPGTGLGLALVKKFVELHQGVVTVKSDQREGSTFTVIIPALQPMIASE